MINYEVYLHSLIEQAQLDYEDALFLEPDPPEAETEAVIDYTSYVSSL